MIALNRHMGTTRITASGSDQLSYCAASTRNTATDSQPEDHHRRVGGLQFEEGHFGPLILHRARQVLVRQLCHHVDRLARTQTGTGLAANLPRPACML